jgi:hypothetical protein
MSEVVKMGMLRNPDPLMIGEKPNCKSIEDQRGRRIREEQRILQK